MSLSTRLVINPAGLYVNNNYVIKLSLGRELAAAAESRRHGPMLYDLVEVGIMCISQIEYLPDSTILKSMYKLF